MVFNNGSSAYFAAPCTVGCLYSGMCPCTQLFVQRDLSKAGLDAAVTAPLEAQPGKHFDKTGDAVRPSRVDGPVVGLMEVPPPACVTGRERDAVVLIRSGGNNFGSQLGEYASPQIRPWSRPQRSQACCIAATLPWSAGLTGSALVMSCSAWYQCPSCVCIRFRIKGTA